MTPDEEKTKEDMRIFLALVLVFLLSIGGAWSLAVAVCDYWMGNYDFTIAATAMIAIVFLCLYRAFAGGRESIKLLAIALAVFTLLIVFSFYTGSTNACRPRWL